MVRPEMTIQSIADSLQAKPDKMLRATGRDLERSLHELSDWRPDAEYEEKQGALRAAEAKVSEWM